MKSLPQLPSVVFYLKENVILLFHAHVSLLHTVRRLSYILLSESGFSFAFQIFFIALVFFFLQWFVRLRGSMRCSLFIHPQCFLNSTLLTCTSYLLSYLPLPSSSLSVYEVMYHTDIRCAVIQSCPASLSVSSTTTLYLAFSLKSTYSMSLVLPPLCLGKLVLLLLVIFSPFVKLVWPS